MPVCPDNVEMNETINSNPFLIDLFVVNKTNAPPDTREKVLVKLKPIRVLFAVFEQSFFKRQRGIYKAVHLIFLDYLFDKLKPSLIRLLHKNTMPSCVSIALTREIFDIHLCEKDTQKIALTHSEFIKMLDTTDDTYVRVTVNLAINSVAIDLRLEFIFKVQEIPCFQNFDGEDLCLNPIL